jgi:hypothetical protein
MEPNDAFRIVRLVRTLSSEIYEARNNDERIAQIDVHYAGEVIYVTVITETALKESAEHRLMSQIDEEIVSSYLPSIARTDLIVTIFKGKEIARYCDSLDNNIPFDDQYDNGSEKN